jgi:hypothetical protein
MFYIGFKTGPRTDSEGWRHAIGGIELGSDSDGFVADLSVWSPREYEAQWREGVARLAAGESSSALVTSYSGAGAAFHFMRPMWRVATDVVFSETLVPGEAISDTNIADAFYRAVGERGAPREDGEPISERIVPLAEVLSFLADDP